MNSYTKLTYRVVFSTKHRRAIITESLRERLYEYIGGIIRAKQGHLIEVGGVADHIHILANFSPAIAVSNMVRDVKANAAKWVNELGVLNERFEWQKGYGAFTVSASQISIVQRYVRNQDEHHRTVSFEEEFIALLNRHGIEFDRRYLFEKAFHG